MQKAELPAQENTFPWAGQPDEIGCNFAFGHLMRNLPGRLTTPGNRLHAETLLAAAGAVAGLAAQISLLADPVGLARAKADGQLLDAKFKDGRVFLYGDALNNMPFTNDVALARSRVWNCLVAGALAKGLDASAIPDVDAMFRHVTSSLGSEREGFPSTPAAHQPLMPARDLLKIVAPVSLACLTGEIDAITDKNNFRAFEPSWVAVTAQMAANQLMAATQALAPGLCITIAMESAIYASKLRGDDTRPLQPQPVAS
jgi:hypothetical protein